MEWTFYFNMALAILCEGLEVYQLRKDFACKSFFRWIRVFRVVVFLAAIVILVYVSQSIPEFSLMRRALSLILLFIVSRGLYDYFAR